MDCVYVEQFAETKWNEVIKKRKNVQLMLMVCGQAQKSNHKQNV